MPWRRHDTYGKHFDTARSTPTTTASTEVHKAWQRLWDTHARTHAHAKVVRVRQRARAKFCDDYTSRCVCSCTYITHPQLCGRQCSLFFFFSPLSLQSMTSGNQSPQDKKCPNLKTQGMLLPFTDKGPLIFKHRTMPAIFNGLIVRKQVLAKVYTFKLLPKELTLFLC